MQTAVAIIALVLVAAMMAGAQEDGRVVAEGAEPVLVQDGFAFTEGPARAADGSVVFSDVRASRRYHWAPESGEVMLVAEETGGANGMYFDPEGNLVICEGERGRMTSIGPDGEVAVVADQYQGARFNRPNDVWVAPDGGVYFTDPLYGGGDLTQDGEHVYYVAPGGGEAERIIDWMTKPNGLIGTADGTTLYITDHGDGKTWQFTVAEGGALTEQCLFVEHGGDGMTIDAEGNVYLATEGVMAFSPAGELIEQIDLPVRPTNMCFAGPELRTLLITARDSVFAVQMRVSGAER
ncbi:MAG: SMP-30/gluconolactonase/LRE family protein [Armatimonadota bacterium]|jgi:gluconolactonase